MYNCEVIGYDNLLNKISLMYTWDLFSEEFIFNRFLFGEKEH
jgi:hypothetical protein